MSDPIKASCGTLADAARYALTTLERYKDTQIGEVRHRLRVTLAAEEVSTAMTEERDMAKARTLLEIILCTAPEHAETRVPHITAALRAEREAVLSWPSDADQSLPEDDAIHAAFPTRSGRHDLYAEAMRLVGARISKGGLVALVNWLLVERAKEHSDAGDDALEIVIQREDELQKVAHANGRAEALAVLGRLVASLPRCLVTGCERSGTRGDSPFGESCDECAERDEDDVPDVAYAPALREALALVGGEHVEGAGGAEEG